MSDEDLFFQDEPISSLPLPEQVQAIKRDLYGAMSDSAVDRKWTKQAIARILELDEALKDLDEEIIDKSAVKKCIRRAEDHLNQLNRY